ncbi:MAG TPA: hypothetical protein ENH55_22250 [Aurantimonas coralicida]|uniref:Uncharacterized protein n=1 Tax=Aurantimonas coralicida TaxID=182270 RepID=A0A9C9NFS7_9HYPH|nr:hypothetical protein [Aurantimonas coralicida]HEU00569.1 hypothetical protein [Aurantimonas coralicida]
MSRHPQAHPPARAPPGAPPPHECKYCAAKPAPPWPSRPRIHPAAPRCARATPVQSGRRRPVSHALPHGIRTTRAHTARPDCGDRAPQTRPPAVLPTPAAVFVHTHPPPGARVCGSTAHTLYSSPYGGFAPFYNYAMRRGLI